MLVESCKRLSENPTFRNVIFGLILFTGVMVGIETYPALSQQIHGLLMVLDKIIIAAFTVELIVRIVAHGRRWPDFFKDGWNVFDFLIVVVCLLPFDAHFAAVARLVRVLRLLRLITTLPRLQMLVGALLKSIPSMGYVGILLGLLFYIYGVIGVFSFGKVDPENFGSLHASLLTLFEIVTLEGWVDIMNTQVSNQPVSHVAGAIAYFVSFILFGTMVMLNLFIGVIISGMEEVQAETVEERQKQGEHPTIVQELQELEMQIGELQKKIVHIKSRV